MTDRELNHYESLADATGRCCPLCDETIDANGDCGCPEEDLTDEQVDKLVTGLLGEDDEAD